MISTTTETDLRQMAERRVVARLWLVPHAVAYLAVNVGLLAFNIATTGSPHLLWLIGSVIGWGCGVAGHAWAAYGPTPEAREAAIRAELERLRR
jgi:hypothetical protein